MAEPLDVDARLAEARTAVDTVGDYVWACHLLGYQNPDLTLHSGQVRDWYGSEDGLDLRALEADRAALESVANAADGARQLQDRQLDALTDAWQGRGGDASHEFLLRHGEASATAASAVHNAVNALAALRDDLWHAVDEKVASTIAIDERQGSERAQWQAATQTVTTGAGDRAVASELVDQQVKPFVDNDIRSEWLTAMQKAMAAVSAAFDAATEALTADLPSTFEVPGDLGPAPVPSSSWSGPLPTETVGTAPAGWASPSPSAAPAPAPVLPAAGPDAIPPPMSAPPLAAPAPAPAPASAMPSMPSMPSLGEMGGGLPGGGGLAGLGSQLADAIGGLLDRPDDALVDPPEPKDDGLEDDELDDDGPVDDQPEAEDDESENEDPGTDDLESDADKTDEPTETDDAGNEPADVCEEEEPAKEPAPPPVSTPPPPEPIVEAPPDAEPLGAETPCEIAADELPQAGPQ